MSKINEDLKYLNLIIHYLKNDKEMLDIEFNDEIKNKDVDIFSEDLFKSLYYNLVSFYRQYEKKNISTKEKKYFFSEVSNLFEIIFETSPNYFFKNGFCKSILIYLINSIKEEDNINIQTILKVFLNFKYIFNSISSKKFEKEVLEFENDIVPTIISLKNRYESDFQKEFDNLQKIENFYDFLTYLNEEKSDLPFYLKGFIDYSIQGTQAKYLLIKIYKFFEIINPYDKINNTIAYNLYQGYSLYGITSCQQILNESFIGLKEFKSIKENRINDINARNILELSIKLLEAKSSDNFIKNIKDDKKINNKVEPPKISNNFDDTKNYYKDLYIQLIYYLNLYKDDNNKVCQIIIRSYSRVLWLNFCRLLILNLKEDDIKKNEIKVIFYFIVNMFNPVANSSSIEFDKDAVPILFSQCQINLLDYKEIMKVIDLNYSKFYPKSNESDKFVEMYINSIIKKVYIQSEKTNSTNNNGIQIYETNNILKYCKTLPFPLFNEYYLKCKTINDEKLTLFFDYCFSDIEDYDKDIFFENIEKINVPKKTRQNINIVGINNIISDSGYIDLIKNIMTSPVMEDAYLRISNYYLTNGKFNINGNMKSTNEKNNLINDQSLFDYYKKFCQLTKDSNNKSNLFIVMGLPEFFKGFTFRFLKIVLNSEGIKLDPNVKQNESDILLKAYLVFVIIHEQNYYIKRFLNVGTNVKLCKTPKIGDKDEGVGGKFLIALLFGDALINKSLNLRQAKYILDINNWRKKTVNDFRNDFIVIETNESNETSIIYLTSGSNSICDHSKLDA